MKRSYENEFEDAKKRKAENASLDHIKAQGNHFQGEEQKEIPALDLTKVFDQIKIKFEKFKTTIETYTEPNNTEKTSEKATNKDLHISKKKDIANKNAKHSFENFTQEFLNIFFNDKMGSVKENEYKPEVRFMFLYLPDIYCYLDDLTKDFNQKTWTNNDINSDYYINEENLQKIIERLPDFRENLEEFTREFCKTLTKVLSEYHNHIQKMASKGQKKQQELYPVTNQSNGIFFMHKNFLEGVKNIILSKRMRKFKEIREYLTLVYEITNNKTKLILYRMYDEKITFKNSSFHYVERFLQISFCDEKKLVIPNLQEKTINLGRNVIKDEKFPDFIKTCESSALVDASTDNIISYCNYELKSRAGEINDDLGQKKESVNNKLYLLEIKNHDNSNFKVKFTTIGEIKVIKLNLFGELYMKKLCELFSDETEKCDSHNDEKTRI